MRLERSVQAMVRECGELTEAESIWKRLNEERASEDLYGTLPGFGAWASSDPEAHPLPLWVALRGTEPVALLPARRTSRQVKGFRLSVLEAAGNEHWTMGSPILGRDPEGSMAALLEGLCLQRGWDVLEIGPMLRESDVLELLLHQSSRLRLGPQITAANEEPVVKLSGTWTAYYQGLSGKLRSQVKRGEARLNKLGPVLLEEYRGGPELEPRLEEFYRVEASGWKGREGTSILSDPCTHRFYTQLARKAAERGWLRLYTLRVGQECVAADYCLAYRGAIYMVKVGYDERWAHCSPGQVMRKRVLQHLFTSPEDKLYSMMPGGGDHRAYKMRWANHVRERVVVRLFHPHSVWGQLALGASRLRAWLRERRGDGGSPSEIGSRMSP